MAGVLVVDDVVPRGTRKELCVGKQCGFTFVAEQKFP